jgi:hypothetical protein
MVSNISVGVCPAISSGFRENANGTCPFYPCLDRKNEVVAAGHVFKCTEFGTINPIEFDRVRPKGVEFDPFKRRRRKQNPLEFEGVYDPK